MDVKRHCRTHFDLDDSHTVIPMTAASPKNQMNRPSATGPSDPSLKPPGEGSSEPALTSAVTSRLASRVRFASLKVGRFCGPVCSARAGRCSEPSARVGAYLPRVRAPPEPTALWHMAQLVRNRPPPAAGSPFDASRYSSSGTAGPGPSDAT